MFLRIFSSGRQKVQTSEELCKNENSKGNGKYHECSMA
jgi:hypothetical protein